MAKLDNNPILAQYLDENKPFLYAHLIKFERPARLGGTFLDNGNILLSSKYTRYAYITDASFDISYQDGSQYWNGSTFTTNPSQVYRANKVLRVGNVSESSDTKIANISISLDASSLDAYMPSQALTFASLSLITATDSFSLAGFREGDIIKFSSTTGANNGKSFRILSFRSEGKTIEVDTIDDTFTNESGVSYTASIASTEITSLVNLDQSTNFVNRQVYIYKVFLDPTNPNLSLGITGTPVLLFNGIITSADYKEDISSTPEITWTIRNHWADFQQVRGRLTADEFHRALDVKGNPSHRGVIRPEYVYDKGFQHANKAIDILGTYTVMETRYKKQTKSGPLGTNKKVSFKPYQVAVEREVDLRFNLQAKYLPVIYGVRRIEATPVFVDTSATDPSSVYLVDAICEGPVQGLINLYVDDSPLICTDEQDSLLRNASTGSAEADVVCYGRADRGDVLSGAASQLLTTQTNNTQDYSGSVTPNFTVPAGADLSFVASAVYGANYYAQNTAGVVYDYNTSISTAVSGSGLGHETKFSITKPMAMEIEFKAGLEDQLASSLMVNQSNQNSGQGFKLQDDANIAVNNYWGADHRLLDTAYVVQKSTLVADQSTVPNLEYVIKGRLVPCYNYDYSFVTHPKRVSASQSVFNLGDTVTIRNITGATVIAANVQIIDKWRFYGAQGIADYRFRFNLNSQQEATLLASKEFYMEKGTDKWYMITHDYSLGTFTPEENLTKKISSYQVVNNQIVATFPANTIPSYLVGSTDTQGSLSLDIPSVLNSLSQGKNINYTISSNYKLTVTSATSVTFQNSGSTSIDATNLYLNVSNKIKLPATGPEATDNYYTGFIAKITNYLPDGTTATIYRTITGYNGTTKVLTLYYPLAAEEVPTTTSRVEIVLPLEYGDYRPTTNLAMMLLDYMTNKKYGAGLLDSQINRNTFLAAARACDTQSDVTISVPSGTNISLGDVYRYSHNSVFKWQGTVKSVGAIVGTIKPVVFTACIGKLTNKFNTWATRQVGDVIHNSDVEANLYRVTTSGVQTAITTNASQLTAGQFTLTRITGTGAASISLGISAGNPVTDYSLYDSDFIKYWKYLGWDSHDQRWVTRHQGNLIINTSDPVLNNISNILNHFNGVIAFEDGRYSVYVETKKDADQDLWWNFLNSSEGWTITNSTSTAADSYIRLTPTAGNPYFIKSGLEFYGFDNQLVRMRIRRTGGTSAFVGKLWYTTLANGTFNDTNSNTITATIPLGEWVTVSWRMTDTNWAFNYVTGLRFQLAAGVGDIFDIEWISIGTNIRVIEQEDIIGAITVKDEGLDKAFNSLSASIPDPQNNFNTRAVSFFNSDYLAEDRGIVKSTNFDLDGVTNYYNARMVVEQLLRRSRFGRTITFTMRPIGIGLTPSDLIRIVYPRFGWNEGKYFRVTSISHREDCLVTVTAEEHSDSIYNIEASKKLKSLSESSRTPTYFLPPTPTSVAATSAANNNRQDGQITLTWTNGNYGSSVSPFMEIWRSETDNRETAIRLATIELGNSSPYVNTFIDTNIPSTSFINTTYYYWIRVGATRVTNLNGRIIINDNFSEFSSSVAGDAGLPGSAYVKISGSQVFNYPSGSSVPSNTSILFVANLSNGLTTYDWEYWNGTTWENLSGTQNQNTYSLTYDNAAWGSSDFLRIRCISETFFDETTVVKVYNGLNPISLSYTNTNHSVPVTTAGVETWAGSGGYVQIYEGITPLVYSTSIPAATGTYNFTITKVSGSTLTIPSKTGIEGNTKVTLADWAGDLTTVTVYRISATIKTNAGTTVVREVDITLSPSTQGATGAETIINFISVNSPVITKDAVDATTAGPHSTLTIQGKKSVGATTSNFGWVTITANGDTELTTATDTATSAISFTPTDAAGKTSYTIRMYNQASVSGATLLDTEVVPVLFKGVNAVVAVYSNDSHSVPVTTAGAETWTGSGGLFEVYEGTTKLTLAGNALSTTTPATNGQYNINITKVSGSTLTIPAITGQTTTTATIADWAGDLTTSTVYRITAYIKTLTGSTVTRQVDLTLSPSLQGATGQDNVSNYITMTSTVITKDAVDSATSGPHSTLTVQGKKTTGSTTVNFGWITITGNGDSEATTATDTATTPINFTPTNAAGKTSYTIRMYNQASVSGATLLDTEVVQVLFKGVNPVVAVYTNESHTVSTSSAGVVLGWNGSGGLFEVYEGITKLTLAGNALSTTTPTTNGQYNLNIAYVSGTELTVPSVSGQTTTTATLGDWSGSLPAVAVYRITAYIKTLTGATVVRQVDATLTPSRQGATGTDGVVTWLSSSVTALAKNALNVFNPTTVTFTAYTKIGAGSTSLYSGRFRIFENGSGTASYTSSADESSKSYTPTTGCTSIKVELHPTGGSTLKLDELGVAIVNDGSNAITVALTNETHVLPSASNGAVTSYAASGTSIRVYEGATELDYDGVGTANGKWNVTAVGTDITPGAKSESGLTAVFADHSAMPNASETATINYSITGKTSIGQSISLTKTQTFSKAKAGDNVTVIFIRSSTVPATPAPSVSTPTNWYASVTEVPAGNDPIWSSIGTRTSAGTGVNWTWQTPIKTNSTSSSRLNAFNHNWVAQDPFVNYNGPLIQRYGALGNMAILSSAGPYGGNLNVLRVRGPSTPTAPGWYGGYRIDYGDVDPTATYLIYLWVRRRSTATTSGLYFGPEESAAGTVANIAATETINANPYFTSNIGSQLTLNQWSLIVGVINPQGTTTASGLGGVYDTNGAKLAVTTTEFRHRSTAVLRQRIRFGFNSTTTAYGSADGFDFYPVGVFKRDGSHPTIDEVCKALPFFNSPQITGFLSNANVTLPTATDGTGASYTGAGGTFRVYDSGIDATNTTDGPVYSIVAPATVSGLTIAIDSASGVYSLSGNWTSDFASFTVRAWYRGQVIDQVYTISKSKQGLSAYNGLLTNENATAIQVISTVNYTPFASGGAVTYATLYENTGGTFKVYSGATEVTSNIVFGISGGTAGVTNTTKAQNGLTMTINNSTGVYSVAGTSWTTDSESFTLTAVVGGVTLSKVYLINRTKDYIAVSLTTTSQLFKYDFAEANPSPAEIVFTATININANYGTYNYRFSKYNPGTNNWTVVRDYATTNTYTLAAGAIGLGTETYKVEVKGGGGNIIAGDSTSILRVKDGLTGSNGSNTANVVLYRRTSSNTAPAVINDDSTYTFSTGLLSNANGLDSWSQTVPSGTSQYLWVTNATAIGANGATTATIPTTGWSTPVVQSEAQQLRTATKLIYNPATATTGVIVPSSTTTGKPYNFTTGALTISTGGEPTPGWTNNQLVTPPYWVSSVSIAETVYDTTQTITYGTPYRVGNTANRDESGLNLANLGGSVGAGQVNITTGGDNLLMNSEFEIRDVNTPAGYTIYNNGGVGSSFIDVAGYISGKAAAVKAGSTPGTSLGILSQSTATGLGVTGGVEGGWKAGVTYIISYYAKKVAGAGFSTMFIGWNRPPNSINVGVVNPTLSTSWQRYVFRIAWAANATVDQIEINGRVYISAGGTIATNDEIHIDRLQVEIADLASEWRTSRRDQVSITGENAPATLRNSNISFSVANNTVSLANAGTGSINIGTFGYSGDLDAQRNSRITVEGGQITGIGSGAGTYVVRNLQDASTWRVGSAPPWGLNQSQTGENSIVWGTGPKGGIVPLWRAESLDNNFNDDPPGGMDGGWEASNTFNVDTTKTYRFMVPFKQGVITSTGAGWALWGIQGNTVCNLNTTTLNNNPYFSSLQRGNSVLDKWYLAVGFVYPAGSTGLSHSGAHIYDMSTGQIVADGNNWCWSSSTTTSATRAYLYYASTGNVQFFAAPTVELVDGKESSINELLQGTAIFNQNIAINAATGVITGIGTGAGLPISANMDSVIRNPVGGTRVTTASTETGRIKIKLPQLNIDNMLKFTVTIYEYLTGYSCILEIAGYSLNGNWSNVTALVQGGSNVEYPVYFGKDSTSLCVWIGGSTGETWSYPQVQVKDFFVGYGITPLTVSTWATGWGISFDQTNIAPGNAANQYSASVADTYPAASWPKVSGTGKPENYATVGAVAGTNLRDSAGTVLSDAAVDNSYNTYGQNLLPNSDIVKSNWVLVYNPNGAEFRDGSNAPLAIETSTGANYRLIGSSNNVEVRQIGVATGTADGSGNSAVGGDFYPYTDSGTALRMAVTPGQTVIASIYINAHRTSGHVYLGFYNLTGVISYHAGDTVTGGQGNSNVLSGYARSYVKATVPAGAVSAILFVRKNNTLAGNSDSYMWWAAPQFEVVNPKAIGPSPYQPGPMTSTRQLGYFGDLNATYGAVTGTTLRNSAGTVLQNADILNSVISLSAAGVLSGAGGGTVTLPGLGQSNYRILTRGSASTTHPSETSGLYKDGVHVHGVSRSYVLVTIKRSDGTRTFQTYDVYGAGEVTNGRTGATLAADLNALTSEFIVVVYSFDEPRDKRLLNNLPAAMYRCGASRAIFGSSEFKYRSAYALVGIPGVGEGNGAEFYQGAVDNSADAWIDVSFSVLNGNISGVSGKYTPRTLADYSYTGDLNATNGATAGANLRSSDGTVVADASFLNSSISLSAAGVLSGAGGGTISLGSLGGTLNTANQMAQNAITSRELAVSNDASGGDGIFIDNVNQRIDIYNGGVLRMRFGKLT